MPEDESYFRALYIGSPVTQMFRPHLSVIQMRFQLSLLAL